MQTLDATVMVAWWEPPAKLAESPGALSGAAPEKVSLAMEPLFAGAISELPSETKTIIAAAVTASISALMITTRGVRELTMPIP